MMVRLRFFVCEFRGRFLLLASKRVCGVSHDSLTLVAFQVRMSERECAHNSNTKYAPCQALAPRYETFLEHSFDDDPEEGKSP